MNTKHDEAIILLKGVQSLWRELSEAEYDCNGGQDFDRALSLLQAEAKAEQPEQIRRLESQLFGEKVCYEAKKKIASELADELGKAMNTIDRLTADLEKHGYHTFDCLRHKYLSNEENPQCTCGWSEIEQDLRKKEGE